MAINIKCLNLFFYRLDASFHLIYVQLPGANTLNTFPFFQTDFYLAIALQQEAYNEFYSKSFTFHTNNSKKPIKIVVISILRWLSNRLTAQKKVKVVFAFLVLLH